MTSGHFRYRVAQTIMVVCLTLSWTPSRVQAETPPIRICADPTNLPFSSDDVATPGFDLEVGQLIAKGLGRKVAYDWYRSYFGKRTTRVTLLAGKCDLMVGLTPTSKFMGPAVIFSKPLTDEGYVFVSRAGLDVESVDDLRGKRVAVQYQSTPQNLLAQRNDVATTTVLSPEAGLEALDQGRVDVAFVWGPDAGWLNKTRFDGRFRIQSLSGPGLSWPVAIGFARRSMALRDDVDRLLPTLVGEIIQLKSKYAFPDGSPAAERRTPMVIKVAADSATRPQISAAAITPTSEAVVLPAGSADAGKIIFNGTCAHCHGPDAIQSERRVNLRRLKVKYAEAMDDTFWQTVHQGRPSKGMPSWKSVFTDEQLRDVLAYLKQMQE